MNREKIKDWSLGLCIAALFVGAMVHGALAPSDEQRLQARLPWTMPHSHLNPSIGPTGLKWIIVTVDKGKWSGFGCAHVQETANHLWKIDSAWIKSYHSLWPTEASAVADADRLCNAEQHGGSK